MATTGFSEIIGLGKLVNLQNVKSGINPVDYEDLDADIKRVETVVDDSKDARTKLSRELANIAKGIGISDIVADDEDDVSEVEADESDSESSDNSSDGNSSDSESSTKSGRPTDTYLRKLTREEKLRGQFNHVLSDIGARGDPYMFEHEKKEDKKAAMLEEIDSLWTSLVRDGIDLSRIPEPTRDTPYEDVDTTLQILRHKNDRVRCTTFAEEFILWAASTVEDWCDGETVYFGRYKPDMTDWTDQVRIKLRRVRHDTSEVVSSLMSDYNISPFMRILLELIPNAFMQSRHNATKRGQRKEIHMSRAGERLRDDRRRH